MPNQAIQHLYTKSVLKVLQKSPNPQLEDFFQLLKEESIQLRFLIGWSVTNAHCITLLDFSVLDPKAFNWPTTHFLRIPCALQHLCPTFLNNPYPPVSAPCSRELPTMSLKSRRRQSSAPAYWPLIPPPHAFTSSGVSIWHRLSITLQGRFGDPNPSLSPACASPFLHCSTGFGVHPARHQV